MNITKLYVPAATLSKNNNISFLEKKSSDLKRQFLGIDIDLK